MKGPLTLVLVTLLILSGAVHEAALWNWLLIAKWALGAVGFLLALIVIGGVCQIFVEPEPPNFVDVLNAELKAAGQNPLRRFSRKSKKAVLR